MPGVCTLQSQHVPAFEKKVYIRSGIMRNGLGNKQDVNQDMMKTLAFSGPVSTVVCGWLIAPEKSCAT